MDLALRMLRVSRNDRPPGPEFDGAYPRPPCGLMILVFEGEEMPDQGRPGMGGKVVPRFGWVGYPLGMGEGDGEWEWGVQDDPPRRVY